MLHDEQMKCSDYCVDQFIYHSTIFICEWMPFTSRTHCGSPVCLTARPNGKHTCSRPITQAPGRWCLSMTTHLHYVGRKENVSNFVSILVLEFCEPDCVNVRIVSIGAHSAHCPFFEKYVIKLMRNANTSSRATTVAAAAAVADWNALARTF